MGGPGRQPGNMMLLDKSKKYCRGLPCLQTVSKLGTTGHPLVPPCSGPESEAHAYVCKFKIVGVAA